MFRACAGGHASVSNAPQAFFATVVLSKRRSACKGKAGSMETERSDRALAKAECMSAVLFDMIAR